MKQGRTLQELAAEVTRQRDTKRDFLVPAQRLKLKADAEDGPMLFVSRDGVPGTEFFTGTTFHDQLSAYLGIPKAYYDRLRNDAPELLCENANHWLQKSDDRRLVRTLDGSARALLSDRYRPLDNFDLLECVLPVLAEREVRVESCEVTERRLFIKGVTHAVQGEVAVGDVHSAGIVISNSEIGNGALAVDEMVWRLACRNGMIVSKAVRRNHVGARATSDEGSWEVFSDETRKLSDAALWGQIRDVVRAALDHQHFTQTLDRLKIANKLTLPKPVETIELVTQRHGLTKEEGAGVLNFLVTGGNLSLFGLVNAVTRYSQEPAVNYERATELEKLGGVLLTAKAEELVTA